MGLAVKARLLGVVAAIAGIITPAVAGANLEDAFDKAFSTASHSGLAYDPFEIELARLADSSKGRIGLAALDLDTLQPIDVLGQQRFPMASTVKIAIIATFLEGVDHGRYHLTDRYPLLFPLPSRKFAGPVAPVRPGAMLQAIDLIEASVTRSDNHATDALLAAIGGPAAVNEWLRRTGNIGIHIDRDIATLVRDDGAVNPANTVDARDSSTPLAMVRLLAGLYNGKWLSPPSRQVLLGAMSRCRTGAHRMRALLPRDAVVAHKTGTLFNTSSDVGIIRTADGRMIAIAIYVTGQGSHPNRDLRIANLARAVWQGYTVSHESGTGIAVR